MEEKNDQKVIILGRVSTSIKAGIPAHVKSILGTFKNDNDSSYYKPQQELLTHKNM